jgi:hypothetical protein
MNENNPYTEGTFDWVSFEWDKLIKTFRRIQEQYDKNITSGDPIKLESAQKDLSGINEILENFRKEYFPSHRKK